MSAKEPAGAGTTILSGRSGKVCAEEIEGAIQRANTVKILLSLQIAMACLRLKVSSF
jgi:hypothetical protein